MKTRRFSGAVAAMTLTWLASAGAVAVAAESDHAAIAARYEKAAVEDETKAEVNRQSAEEYRKRGGAAVTQWHLDQHCDSLAKAYDAAAGQNRALASAHRGMAKQQKKREGP
jgi:hypothetical protein